MNVYLSGHALVYYSYCSKIFSVVQPQESRVFRNVNYMMKLNSTTLECRRPDPTVNSYLKNREKKLKVPPRFELGSLDSKSRVLTITPWDRSHKQAKKIAIKRRLLPQIMPLKIAMEFLAMQKLILFQWMKTCAFRESFNADAIVYQNSF